MVLLTMTASIVEAIETLDEETVNSESETILNDEPSLQNPIIGNPISHSQIIDIWKKLKKQENNNGSSLEGLLTGAMVYIPPLPPKPEPVRLSYRPLPLAAAHPVSNILNPWTFRVKNIRP